MNRDQTRDQRDQRDQPTAGKLGARRHGLRSRRHGQRATRAGGVPYIVKGARRVGVGGGSLHDLACELHIKKQNLNFCFFLILDRQFFGVS